MSGGGGGGGGGGEKGKGKECQFHAPSPSLAFTGAGWETRYCRQGERKEGNRGECTVQCSLLCSSSFELDGKDILLDAASRRVETIDAPQWLKSCMYHTIPPFVPLPRVPRPPFPGSHRIAFAFRE